MQLAAALLQNANFKGFFTGKIYQGEMKSVCVPGLNCYSCPGAVGACPLGSLQAGLGQLKFRFPYYVVGLLLFFGALFGRAVCGFLCPFGFIQELLNKIPFFKKVRRWRFDRPLRYVKYGFLVLLVVVLPICVKLTPFFCKYVCPSGTIAGTLLALADSGIRGLLGPLYAWKAAVLAAIVLLSLLIWRPFCKYICPLGAVYGFFNRVSLFRLRLDRDRCVGCGACERTCGMCVDPAKTPDSAECIRCGDCVSACPYGALSLGFGGGAGREPKENKS